MIALPSRYPPTNSRLVNNSRQGSLYTHAFFIILFFHLLFVIGQDFIREKVALSGFIDDRARLGGPGMLSVVCYHWIRYPVSSGNLQVDEAKGALMLDA